MSSHQQNPTYRPVTDIRPETKKVSGNQNDQTGINKDFLCICVFVELRLHALSMQTSYNSKRNDTRKGSNDTRKRWPKKYLTVFGNPRGAGNTV